MKADAVFEGGGIRGIAFAGAIQAMEENNVEWVRLAGTSVGSIIASLLAAGYKSTEINEQIKSIDFHLLRGKTWLNRILSGKHGSFNHSFGYVSKRLY